MQFLILLNAGKARVMPSEATETGEYGEAPAMAEHPCSRTAPVRFSAHKMSVVDGPFPETKQ
jgi:hypothetical protein